MKESSLFKLGFWFCVTILFLVLASAALAADVTVTLNPSSPAGVLGRNSFCLNAHPWPFSALGRIDANGDGSEDSAPAGYVNVSWTRAALLEANVDCIRMDWPLKDYTTGVTNNTNATSSNFVTNCAASNYGCMNVSIDQIKWAFSQNITIFLDAHTMPANLANTSASCSSSTGTCPAVNRSVWRSYLKASWTALNLTARPDLVVISGRNEPSLPQYFMRDVSPSYPARCNTILPFIKQEYDDLVQARDEYYAENGVYFNVVIPAQYTMESGGSEENCVMNITASLMGNNTGNRSQGFHFHDYYNNNEVDAADPVTWTEQRRTNLANLQAINPSFNRSRVYLTETNMYTNTTMLANGQEFFTTVAAIYSLAYRYPSENWSIYYFDGMCTKNQTITTSTCYGNYRQMDWISEPRLMNQYFQPWHVSNLTANAFQTGMTTYAPSSTETLVFSGCAEHNSTYWVCVVGNAQNTAKSVEFVHGGLDISSVRKWNQTSTTYSHNSTSIDLGTLAAWETVFFEVNLSPEEQPSFLGFIKDGFVALRNGMVVLRTR